MGTKDAACLVLECVQLLAGDEADQTGSGDQTGTVVGSLAPLARFIMCLNMSCCWDMEFDKSRRWPICLPA